MCVFWSGAWVASRNRVQKSGVNGAARTMADAVISPPEKPENAKVLSGGCREEVRQSAVVAQSTDRRNKLSRKKGG